MTKIAQEALSNFRLKNRFRGFLPVVIDIETSGFNPEKNALLEISAVFLKCDGNAKLSIGEVLTRNLLPFDGAVIEPTSLKFLGINDPFSPLRQAITETTALNELFLQVNLYLKEYECTRAILVGHNASFDLSFLSAATKRTKLKFPFHQFSTLDTVSLSGAVYGETVLAKSVAKAGIKWNNNDAHCAEYDATKTAELFCHICNNFSDFASIK